MSMARPRRNRRVEPQPVAADGRLRVLRRVAAAALALALVGALTAGIATLFRPDTMPIREVRVEGEFRELSPARLEAIVEASIDGGFFSVDVGRVHAALLLEPWVQAASVQRVWPGALLVSVQERRAVAHWRGTALLTAGGDVFTPAPETAPARLPALSGPEGTQRLVLDRFRELGELLAPAGFSVTELLLSERGAWRFRLAAGPEVVVGRDEFHARVHRLIASLDQLLAQPVSRIDTIDLRYTNGLAVALKTNPVPEEEA